jgi:stage III sporulation protein AG
MDQESGKQQFIAAIKKYQYVLLVVLIGIFLMLLPSNTKVPQMIPDTTIETTSYDLEKELAEILSHIFGVGKVEVLLTESSGSNTIYQMDTGQNHSNLDTVVITNQNREEMGLIKQVLSPVYKGALVVCQGADHANVRLAVVEAVKSVTGLSSDCITVLKMK